jgi:hypothetical protein
MVASNPGKHHAWDIVLVMVLVKMNTLIKGRKAVADTGNRNANLLRHGIPSISV